MTAQRAVTPVCSRYLSASYSSHPNDPSGKGVRLSKNRLFSRASVISEIRHLSGGSAWTTRVTEAVCLPPRMERVDEGSPSLVYAFFYARRSQFSHERDLNNLALRTTVGGAILPSDVRHHIFPTPNRLELLLQKLHCLSDDRVRGVHCFSTFIVRKIQLATGQQFPRQVDVIASQTYLRAGPGDDFYPTARLIHGETLELWSVSESGYGAVRPLTGSFSWLRAADVDREIEDDPEVGVVITDGAVSRIGSQINALRHVAQVRLEAGERVRVLDEVRVQEGRHKGLWLKVAPPAGEFRWARLEELDLPVGLAPRTSAVIAVE